MRGLQDCSDSYFLGRIKTLCAITTTANEAFDKRGLVIIPNYIAGENRLSFKIVDTKSSDDDDVVGRWSMQELPGCCMFIVSTGMCIDPKLRGHGIAGFCQKLKEEIAKLLGYTYLLCTVAEPHYQREMRKPNSQKYVLRQSGWVGIFSDINRRTDNDVTMYVKKVGL